MAEPLAFIRDIKNPVLRNITAGIFTVGFVGGSALFGMFGSSQDQSSNIPDGDGNLNVPPPRTPKEVHVRIKKIYND